MNLTDFDIFACVTFTVHILSPVSFRLSGLPPLRPPTFNPCCLRLALFEISSNSSLDFLSLRAPRIHTDTLKIPTITINITFNGIKIAFLKHSNIKSNSSNKLSKQIMILHKIVYKTTIQFQT